METGDSILASIAELGQSTILSEEAIAQCERYLCSLYSTKKESFESANELRWHEYKRTQSIDKLPPTPGAWREHTLRSHCHCYDLVHEAVISPERLQQTDLGWNWVGQNAFPILSKEPIVTNYLIKLIKCGCQTSYCTKKCNCKNNGVHCIELCGCEGAKDKCQNPNNTSASDDNIDTDI